MQGNYFGSYVDEAPHFDGLPFMFYQQLCDIGKPNFTNVQCPLFHGDLFRMNFL
jgi:hypothetical protein